MKITDLTKEVITDSNNKKLKTYEIWCNIKDHYYDYEGINMFGSAEATSFKSACDKFFIKNVLYVGKDLTYKGCKLYKSQIEALDGEEGILS